MKVSREAIYHNSRSIPTLRFEDQQMTSFAGLVVFESLLRRLGWKKRLRDCCAHLRQACSYSGAVIVELLVVHLLLGYRRLQDVGLYRNDPMVLRLLGLKRVPDVSVLSRALRSMDAKVVQGLRAQVRDLVLERLVKAGLKRVTLDFDGSVQSTRRRAEATAVGYNRVRKGGRSYYPLLCTVGQTAQVFDILFRPGNVHDSNGALEFVVECIERLRERMPWVQVEVRMDGAFFSEEMAEYLGAFGAEFSISVPFERLAVLKGLIEQRRYWKRLGDRQEGFEKRWKPNCWRNRYRFLMVRRRVRERQKTPLQLDLFEPISDSYEYKVIITNKRAGARSVVAFHEGRGNQEGLIGELKSHAAMDYVPVRTWIGNQVYLLCGILAHNLGRELQMQSSEPVRKRSHKRSALWRFEQMGTLRKKWIQRAGRLTRPEGRLTLTLGTNEAVQNRLLQLLGAST